MCIVTDYCSVRDAACLILLYSAYHFVKHGFHCCYYYYACRVALCRVKLTKNGSQEWISGMSYFCKAIISGKMEIVENNCLHIGNQWKKKGKKKLLFTCVIVFHSLCVLLLYLFNFLIVFFVQVNMYIELIWWPFAVKPKSWSGLDKWSLLFNTYIQRRSFIVVRKDWDKQ